MSEALDRLFTLYHEINKERQSKHWDVSKYSHVYKFLEKLDTLITIMTHFKDLEETQQRFRDYTADQDREIKRLLKIIEDLTYNDAGKGKMKKVYDQKQAQGQSQEEKKDLAD